MILWIVPLLAITATSCTKMMGNLRRDLDDSVPYSEPTVGGAWTERGLLDGNDAGSFDRRPASINQGDQGGGSWVTPDQQEINRRDRFRHLEGAPSYASQPNLPPPTRRAYKNGSRATKADFIDESASEGSLWASDGQTNYYFTKNKIRGVGDLITVSTQEGLFKDVMTETLRTLSPSEYEQELNLAQARLERAALGIGPGSAANKSAKKDAVKTSAAAPARTPADGEMTEEDKEIEEQEAADRKLELQKKAISNIKATRADVDLSQSVEFKQGDPIMAEIVERFPNGNYKIRGTKRIRYRNGVRLLSIVGVVRGSDITENEDLVESGKLYEYRLEVIR